MKSKFDLLHKNVTWDLVSLPSDKTALPCKWVYKLKVIANDGKPKYKARIVAKGFKQQKGIDFDEIFSHVVNMTTLRCALALVAKEDMELVQMDVKTEFLHGYLHEDIYMQQPEGFVVKGFATSFPEEELACDVPFFTILSGLLTVLRGGMEKVKAERWRNEEALEAGNEFTEIIGVEEDNIGNGVELCADSLEGKVGSIK
ncbi:hypothetical protein L7F22_036358 [Adiantum nelumboides]|nr:hypothetical protein [Adiantum nelumboides]